VEKGPSIECMSTPCRESEILDNLTPNLRAAVTQFAHKDTVKLLKSMKLFEDLEEALITRLIVSLKSVFLPPEELVCSEGELGEILYIIRKGVVSVRPSPPYHFLITSLQCMLLCVLLLMQQMQTTEH
jgi:hypothetical protein